MWQPERLAGIVGSEHGPTWSVVIGAPLAIRPRVLKRGLVFPLETEMRDPDISRKGPPGNKEPAPPPQSAKPPPQYTATHTHDTAHSSDSSHSLGRGPYSPQAPKHALCPSLPQSLSTVTENPKGEAPRPIERTTCTLCPTCTHPSCRRLPGLDDAGCATPLLHPSRFSCVSSPRMRLSRIVDLQRTSKPCHAHAAAVCKP